MKKRPAPQLPLPAARPASYPGLIGGIGALLDASRHTAVRAVNSLMTATYWEIGRRIVEFEQGGKKRAGYGEELLEKLARDLTKRFGRGFSETNLKNFRLFALAYPSARIRQTVSDESLAPKSPTLSGQSPAPNRPTLSDESPSHSILSAASIELELLPIRQTVSAKFGRSLSLADLARAFPLPWSHYVLLPAR